MLKERAEELNYKELEKGVPKPLPEYLCELYEEPDRRIIFLVGEKGVGKTFSIMRASRMILNKHERALPVVLSYSNGRRYMLDPLKLASPSEWGTERLKKLNEKHGDPLIVDDMHYEFESLSNERAKELLKEMEKILAAKIEGRRVWVISDELLSSYIKRARETGVVERRLLDRLEEYSVRIGCPPLFRDVKSWKKLDKQFSPLNFVEASNYLKWDLSVDLWNVYGVKADDAVKILLAEISNNPRFFIRFIKKFYKGERIKLENVIRGALRTIRQTYHLDKTMADLINPYDRAFLVVDSIEYEKLGSMLMEVFVDYFFGIPIEKELKEIGDRCVSLVTSSVPTDWLSKGVQIELSHWLSMKIQNKLRKKLSSYAPRLQKRLEEERYHYRKIWKVEKLEKRLEGLKKLIKDQAEMFAIRMRSHIFRMLARVIKRELTPTARKVWRQLLESEKREMIDSMVMEIEKLLVSKYPKEKFYALRAFFSAGLSDLYEKPSIELL